MTEKELKKFSRAALIRIVLERTRENEELRQQLRIVGDKLAGRDIQLENAGSIAQAALTVNGVFEAAQAAAAQYLENIETLSNRQDAACAKREEDSCREAERLLMETRRQCEQMEAETERRCTQLLEQAGREADDKWNEISGRLEAFYQSHQGLRELLEKSGLYIDARLK